MNDIQRFRMINFSGYFGLGALASMTIPLLLHKGFSPGQIGIITACYTLAGFFSNYIIGYICDRFGTVKRVYQLVYVVSTILVLILTLTDSKSLFLVTYISSGFFLNGVMNLTDSWVMEHSQETRLKYGAIRSFGSIGWAACTLFIGYMIDFTGYWIIGIFYFIMALFAFTISSRIPDSPKEPSNLKPKDVLQLFSIPNYSFFLLCLLFFGISHGSFGYLPPYIIQSIGGGNGELGFYNFACAASEIIILAYSMRLIHRLGEEKLFLLASIAMIARFGLFLLADNLLIVYLAGVMHMFTFGAFLVSTKSIIDKLTPSHLKTTGQMLWAAVFIGVGMVISSTLNGYFVEQIGVHHTLYIFLMIALVATGLIYVYYRRTLGASTEQSVVI